MLEIQEFKHKNRLIVLQMRQRYKEFKILTTVSNSFTNEFPLHTRASIIQDLP